MRATVSSTLSTVNMTLRRPSVFGGAIAGSISTSFGLRNFVSSSRPCPSGVRIITMSTWTFSSPLTRSTHGPSTGISPSSVMPSAVKKAIAAARSSTTTLTWSNRLIVMSLISQRPCAAVQADRSRELDAVLGLDTTAGDAEDDAALAQGQTEVTVVVTLVGMELVRSATGPAARLGADGLDGVDGGEHHLRIVHVRGAHQDRERDAVGVDHKMALRALFAAIRWVLARFLAPPGAGTAAESSAARSQSMRSAWASSSRSTWCSLRQTPAWYQSRSLRQPGHPAPTPHLGRQVLPG